MNTPLLTKQMDASNEFCFISAPSGLKKKSKKRVGDESQDSDLRNVPVCVTSTNRNVKLRFVWDKAFKLFQSHRPVYKAMSGINYQDYGTGGSSSRKSGAGSCGTGTSFSSSCVGGGRRSRSQSQLSDFEDSEILDLNLKPIPIKKSSGASKTSRGKEKRPWSISGGEKPEGEDDDVNGKEGSSGTGSRRPALANCNLTSKCNVNNGPNGSHHASCTPPSEQVGNISTCGGGVAHPLRRSRSSCMSSTGASATTGEGKWKVHEDNQEHQSNFASSSGGRKSNSWARTGSISPEEDSGLDTWKSPRQGSGRIGGSSIVCTIGQRAKHGIEDRSSSSCGSMMRENPTGNTTVVLIAPRENEDLDLSTSTTTDFFVELDDIECMSEIDLTSEAGSGTLCELEDSIEDLVGLGAVGEDKEKMKLKTAANMTTSHSHLPYHPENEFDSLDLTLFEKESEGIGMTESERYFFQMQMIQGFSLESDSDHIYDTVAMEDGDDGRNSRVMGGSDTLSVWNWSDAGSEFEFMSPATQQATELTKTPATSNSNREIPLGHSPRGQAPEVEWEPYFCVLNQLDQTFTSYRSEEMSIFPGTPTRPRTPSPAFADNGASPAEVPRIRLDGGPSSIKCLINNSKWGMNPVLEEEEGETTMSNGTEKGGRSSDISSSGSGSNQRNSSPASPLGKFPINS